MIRRKLDSPERSCMDVGEGDFVRVAGSWYEIKSNSAKGAPQPPKSWTIKTKDGKTIDSFNAERYAKSEDMEEIEGSWSNW